MFDSLEGRSCGEPTKRAPRALQRASTNEAYNYTFIDAMEDACNRQPYAKTQIIWGLDISA